MSTLGRALVETLDDHALDLLADRLLPRLTAAITTEHASEPWLDSKAAAGYLGVSVSALHKLTAARKVPFEQEAPGCKLWFRQPDLDSWRRGGIVRSRREEGG